jgi:predicted phage-related endonuclease
MARHIDNVNGIKLNWLGAKQFETLWFHKNEQDEIVLEEIVVDKIDDAEIENLFNAEIKGETYRPRELIIAQELQLKLQQAEIELAKKELEMKEYEEAAKNYREQLKEMMEKQNILNWVSPNGIVKVSYVSPYVKSTVDSKKLQKEKPDIYNKYLKTSKVKGTVKVSVDEEKLQELENGTTIPSLEY